MEGDDSHKQYEKEDSDPLSNISDFFQSLGFRCPLRSDNEMDRVLLDYGFNFLPSFSVILWTIFLIF